MYALLELFQRSERHRLLRQLETADSEQARVDIVAEELDYILEPICGEMERQQLYKGVVQHLRGGRPRPVGFKQEDLTGGFAWVVMAILAVVPSLVPFVLLRDQPGFAIRVSNIISFAMLFLAGHQWGVHTGANPWKTGLLLFGVGVLMVAIAIPLGG
jgi:VIT1/CCC1 family predicted Fe2+/Mn2+ transporter